jgi:iron complex transport system substrate-binding protein
VSSTDLSATYPPEADALPQIGYQRALSAEPIAALEPTVVLATDLAGPVETLDQLRALGIPVVVIEREPTLDGPGNKIRAVAGALGISGRGDELARSTDADIARAAEAGLGAAPALRPRVLVLYLRGEQVQLVMGAGTGVDALLPAVGAVDVAAELGVIDTEQLTAEALVLAAPDALVVTDTGLESVGGIDGLLSIPGIAQTPAGAARRVLAYDDQLLLGGGPRTGELMRQLAADLVASTVPTPTQEDS